MPCSFNVFWCWLICLHIRNVFIYFFDFFLPFLDTFLTNFLTSFFSVFTLGAVFAGPLTALIFEICFFGFITSFFTSIILSVHSILTISALSPLRLGREIILVNPEVLVVKEGATFLYKASTASLWLSKLAITRLIPARPPFLATVTNFSRSL